MSTGNFKQDASICRWARGEGRRSRQSAELLEFVAQGRAALDELASMTKLSVANTSKHLQELRRAGLAKARKEGVRVFYEVAGSDVTCSVRCASLPRSRVAEASRNFAHPITSRDDLEPVPPKSLCSA
ncbi:MAG: helix-turn-helix transcriptional regulator [Sulfuritalea sp.]|nr:helix-turn-helix transcriptional regulator [Sulfuritalea sp.]